MATTASHVQIRGRYLWKDDERVRVARRELASERVLTLCKFLAKGVVYQGNHSDDFSPGGRDLISDDRFEQLQHDVQLFQELGINILLICRFTWLFKRRMR